MDDNDTNFTLTKWACMPLWCRKYSYDSVILEI